MAILGKGLLNYMFHIITSSLLEMISGLKGMIATTKDEFSQSRIVCWLGAKMTLTELSEIVGITIANHSILKGK